MSSWKVASAYAISLAIMVTYLIPYANGVAPVQGTQTFTTAMPPRLISLCSGICMEVTYKNNVNFTVTGIVYTVVHNSLGQTVSYQTVTITPAGGQDATPFFVVSVFLSYGTYNASVFVVTPSGMAISTISTIGFSVS